MHTPTDRSSSLRSAALRKESSLAIILAVCAVLGAASQAQAQRAPEGQASATPTVGLEEIIVTATRRAEALENVPISVQAFSQEKMDKQGIRDIGDIAAYTPSLEYSQSDGLRTLNNRISIRGVTSSVGAPTTGIYIDETPIAIRTLRTNGDPSATPFPQLFDIERVEVLRGPQGTLFGSGSEGGTVRFITPEPNMTNSSVYTRFGTSITKGGSPSWEAGAAGGAPILEDRLGFRISASASQTGGYISHGNYYTGMVDQADYNWQKSINMRVALKLKVTDEFTISPSFYHQQITANGGNGFYLPDNTNGVDTTNPAYVAYYQRYGGQFDNFGHFGDGARPGHYVSAEGTIGSSTQYMNLTAVNFKYSLPKIDIIYNPSVYDTKQDNVSDFTFLSYQIFPLFVGASPVTFPSNPGAKSPEYDNQDNRAVTHELRVQNSDPDARVNWVVGLYLFNQRLFSHSAIDNKNWGLVLQDSVNAGWDPSWVGCSAADLAACQPPWLAFYQNRYGVWLDTWGWSREKAVFGQADIKITDHLTGTLGVRRAQMEFQSRLFSAGVFDGPGTTETATSKVNLTLPKYGLQYTFDEGKMIYASAAKGGRPGGVNQNITDPRCLALLKSNWGLDKAPLQYNGDTVWSYELGTKFRTLNNKLSVDANIYQINWDDIIRNVTIDSANTGQCIFSYTTNMGKARSRGAELSVQYLPIDSLNLTAAVGYAKIQSTSSIPVPDPSQPDGVAHNANGVIQYVTRNGAILDGSNTTFSLAAQYAFTAFSKSSYARADFRYRGTPKKGDSWDPNSAQYAGAANLFETPSTKTLNLRLGTRLSDWDVSAYVNNVTNTQPLMRTRLGQLGSESAAWMSGGTLVRPRELGVTAVYRY